MVFCICQLAEVGTLLKRCVCPGFGKGFLNCGAVYLGCLVRFVVIDGGFQNIKLTWGVDTLAFLGGYLIEFFECVIVVVCTKLMWVVQNLVWWRCFCAFCNHCSCCLYIRLARS